jgi:hypothetical protein
MRGVSVLTLLSLLTLSGCAGLRQFPQTPMKYSEDLKARDGDYDAALQAIASEADENKQRQLRNTEIDRRVRVIDLNFEAFVEALAKENVRANFGLAVTRIGVGAAGALVAETASQIPSAVSGGLAGAQAAYGKTAFYEQTCSALHRHLSHERRAAVIARAGDPGDSDPLNRGGALMPTGVFTITDIPDDKLATVTADFHLEHPRPQISKTNQPNGLWTVTATFPGAGQRTKTFDR